MGREAEDASLLFVAASVCCYIGPLTQATVSLRLIVGYNIRTVTTAALKGI